MRQRVQADQASDRARITSRATSEDRLRTTCRWALRFRQERLCRIIGLYALEYSVHIHDRTIYILCQKVAIRARLSEEF
eukprot:6188483-Pleurochrysis_carterae.AAC.1